MVPKNNDELVRLHQQVDYLQADMAQMQDIVRELLLLVLTMANKEKLSDETLVQLERLLTMKNRQNILVDEHDEVYFAKLQNIVKDLIS